MNVKKMTLRQKLSVRPTKTALDLMPAKFKDLLQRAVALRFEPLLLISSKESKHTVEVLVSCLSDCQSISTARTQPLHNQMLLNTNLKYYTLLSNK